MPAPITMTSVIDTAAALQVEIDQISRDHAVTSNNEIEAVSVVVQSDNVSSKLRMLILLAACAPETVSLCQRCAAAHKFPAPSFPGIRTSFLQVVDLHVRADQIFRGKMKFFVRAVLAQLVTRAVLGADDKFLRIGFAAIFDDRRRAADEIRHRHDFRTAFRMDDEFSVRIFARASPRHPSPSTYHACCNILPR